MHYARPDKEQKNLFSSRDAHSLHRVYRCVIRFLFSFTVRPAKMHFVLSALGVGLDGCDNGLICVAVLASSGAECRQALHGVGRSANCASIVFFPVRKQGRAASSVDAEYSVSESRPINFLRNSLVHPWRDREEILPCKGAVLLSAEGIDNVHVL